MIVRRRLAMPGMATQAGCFGRRMAHAITPSEIFPPTATRNPCWQLTAARQAYGLEGARGGHIERTAQAMVTRTIDSVQRNVVEHINIPVLGPLLRV
jgi:hypothetical protein